MSTVLLRQQPAVVVARKADGTVVLLRQMIAGTPGVGVPAGGTAGQVLGKTSGTNYDTGWVAQAGGNKFGFLLKTPQTLDIRWVFGPMTFTALAIGLGAEDATARVSVSKNGVPVAGWQDKTPTETVASYPSDAAVSVANDDLMTFAWTGGGSDLFLCLSG